MVMMRYVLCILALLLSCACVHVLAEEVPAADLSDQVPDTESETKIINHGTQCADGVPTGTSADCALPVVQREGSGVASVCTNGTTGKTGECNSLLEKPVLGADGSLCPPGTPEGAQGKCTPPVEKSERVVETLECPPGETSRTHEGTCPSVKQPAELNPALPPQQELQPQPDLNPGGTDNVSLPAGSEGQGNTSSTAGNVDSQRPQQNTTEGEATASTEGTTSSGDVGSNNTNPQTQPESVNEGGESNPGNQATAAADTTGTEGSRENGNADSTTTTTITTTLPPETANNKKGDADSSSSISSSVWVRVPLLIVVTLSCILVC
ncbi:uncharacterized protein TM35_000581220 [Trypanosoma theileri]|uniref:Titin n=1 Tax=Trypanosoma theileri TaxID=67003 RepID=A0A1X0NHV7_9TRYP|nr:uncharacterized protein TM35_000581220 [Trypanosoma theileri]ORC83759.1 hypothetical protein TM35_000581220 [Trypanosoma theileri]